MSCMAAVTDTLTGADLLANQSTIKLAVTRAAVNGQPIFSSEHRVPIVPPRSNQSTLLSARRWKNTALAGEKKVGGKN